MGKEKVFNIRKDFGYKKLEKVFVRDDINESEDSLLLKEKIENSVNPRKWICVEAEDVEVESKGNLILLVMSSESTTEKIENSFKNLK